mgnify:CR=1 FL=1
MGKFEIAKDLGLSAEQERKFNLIRGCILGSFLEHKEKVELCEFINELENYFNSDDIKHLKEV